MKCVCYVRKQILTSFCCYRWNLKCGNLPCSVGRFFQLSHSSETVFEAELEHSFTDRWWFGHTWTACSLNAGKKEHVSFPGCWIQSEGSYGLVVKTGKRGIWFIIACYGPSCSAAEQQQIIYALPEKVSSWTSSDVPRILPRKGGRPRI